MSLTIPRVFELPAAGLAPPLNWRKLLPSSLRLAYRLARVGWNDLRTGIAFKMAVPRPSSPPMEHCLVLSQPVLPNAWTQNKLHNFKQAARPINCVTLLPGEVFSFWKIIGKPTLAKGYKPGRNLVNGQVQETVGGGLCQVSGILYHLSLMAGLRVLERHNHSVDLYANGEPRFTPLGSDATVAFGYKDLRVANPFGFAIRFELEVQEDTLVCRLRSEKKIAQQSIEFRSLPMENGVQVIASRILPNRLEETLAQSFYGFCK